MSQTPLETMRTFTSDALPNLDIAVLGALELFTTQRIPSLELGDYKRPLVVGSGNAAVTGRILFKDKDAVLADESTYKEKLESLDTIDGAILLSASGSKHAIEIAETLRKHNIETRLLTNNAGAPAKEFIDEDKFFAFPKNREPYTYNTSTYMGMILAKTKEDPQQIKQYLLEVIDPLIPNNFRDYDAHYFIIPNEYDATRRLFLTKFDELFQPVVSGRVFTPEQSKHAKSVARNTKELFTSFGYDNKDFGPEENRLFFPLPDWAQEAAVMAIVYYVIGKMQEQYPAYYKDGIAGYIEKASKIFGKELHVIVE